MELFDSLCHLDDPAFDQDRAQVLQDARRNGVRQLLVPGVAASGWTGITELCRDDDGLFPALGLHPAFLEQHERSDIELLEQMIAQQRPTAIGEIGLDFFIPQPDRDGQQALFEAQLEIARSADLPVVLHVRKAHDQVLAALRRIRVTGGTAHAFNGSFQQAQQYIDMGFKLGFGGTLTYARSRKIRALARDLPLDALVLETDAPDIVVAPHRGERNSPEYLTDCLQSLAEIRNEAPEYLAAQTTANARAVFRLDASLQ
ncbi:MAG: TatD family hydrolase [Thiogranum sp.]|nr:TatD family hydrolase [Thiogranum sp.]